MNSKRVVLFVAVALSVLFIFASVASARPGAGASYSMQFDVQPTGFGGVATDAQPTGFGGISINVQPTGF